MIKLLITSFFIYIQNFNKNNMHLKCEKYKTISDANITENIFDKEYKKGFDMRYNIFYKDCENDLGRIKRNFRYKGILSYLQNKNNTIHNKIKLIQENDLLEDTLETNILSGGLLDDWDYNF